MLPSLDLGLGQGGCGRAKLGAPGVGFQGLWGEVQVPCRGPCTKAESQTAREAGPRMPATPSPRAALPLGAEGLPRAETFPCSQHCPRSAGEQHGQAFLF